MKRLIATKNLSTYEWLKNRRRGICGSDASIILGMNPYRSVLELWEDKTGRIPIQENENDYTHFGHVLEPVIRKEFMKRTGLKVRMKNYILQSDTYEWALADIDGVVKEKDGSYALFEAKTASEYKKEVWEKGVPDEYQVQVQHYLHILGYERAYVCALVGGNSFFIHVIERDEIFITELMERERIFWDCVINDVPPQPDGAKATTEFLNSRYEKSNKTEVQLPESAEMMASSYLELDALISELTKKKHEISNGLKNLLKDNEKGIAGKHVISWPTVCKNSLDTKRVREALGENYKEYMNATYYRRFSIA